MQYSTVQCDNVSRTVTETKEEEQCAEEVVERCSTVPDTQCRTETSEQCETVINKVSFSIRGVLLLFLIRPV